MSFLTRPERRRTTTLAKKKDDRLSTFKLVGTKLSFSYPDLPSEHGKPTYLAKEISE